MEVKQQINDFQYNYDMVGYLKDLQNIIYDIKQYRRSKQMIENKLKYIQSAENDQKQQNQIDNLNLQMEQIKLPDDEIYKRLNQIFNYFDSLVVYLIENFDSQKSDGNIYNDIIIKMYVLTDIYHMKYILNKKWEKLFEMKEILYDKKWLLNINAFLRILNDNKQKKMNYINGIYDKLSKEVSADEFFKDSQNIVYLVKLMKICYIKFIDLKWYTKKRFIYADVGNEPFFGFDICAIQYPQLYAIYFQKIDYVNIDDYWLSQSQKKDKDPFKFYLGDDEREDLSMDELNQFSKSKLENIKNQKEQFTINNNSPNQIHLQIMNYMQKFYNNQLNEIKAGTDNMHCSFIWYLQHVQLRDDTIQKNQENRIKLLQLMDKHFLPNLQQNEQIKESKNVLKFQYVCENTPDENELQRKLQQDYVKFYEFIEKDISQSELINLYINQSFNVANYQLDMYIQNVNYNYDNMNVYYDVIVRQRFRNNPKHMWTDDICYNQKTETNLIGKIKETKKKDNKQKQNCETCNNILQNLLNISSILYKFTDDNDFDVLNLNENNKNIILVIYKCLSLYYGSEYYKREYNTDVMMNYIMQNAINTQAQIQQNQDITSSNIKGIQLTDQIFQDYSQNVIGDIQAIINAFNNYQSCVLNQKNQYNNVQFISNAMQIQTFFEKYQQIIKDHNFDVNKIQGENKEIYNKRKNQTFDICNYYLMQAFFYIFLQSKIQFNKDYHQYTIQNFNTQQLDYYFRNFSNQKNFDQNYHTNFLKSIKWNSSRYVSDSLFNMRFQKNTYSLMFYNKLYNFFSKNTLNDDYYILFQNFIINSDYFVQFLSKNEKQTHEQKYVFCFLVYKQILYLKFATFYVNNNLVEQYTHDQLQLLYKYEQYKQVMFQWYNEQQHRYNKYFLEIEDDFKGGNDKKMMKKKCKACNKTKRQINRNMYAILNKCKKKQ